MLSTQRSPLAPLKKGENNLKVPLFSSEAVHQHGDLEGSVRFATCDQTFKTSSKCEALALEIIDIIEYASFAGCLGTISVR